MFGAIKQIKQDIKEMKHKQERIIWIMNEVMKYGKKMQSHNQSARIYNPAIKTPRQKHEYYHALLPLIKNKFKRIDQLAKSLKITEGSVITYIKLARKAGYTIETKRRRNGRASYKLHTENF